MSVTTELAESILRAHESGVPIGPVRGRISGVDAAYAIQQETVRVWRERKRAVAGQKIGLTSKAIQQQLGVNEPDFGTLFRDMILDSGATIARNRVLQPRIEGELAFVLKKDLSGSAVTPEAVIEATDYVVPAIEICGSRIAGWDIRIEDTIADNASAGLVVIGDRRHKPDLATMPEIPMRLVHNGIGVAEGNGAACLGNPAMAVAWLAQALTRLGGGLRAGDIVMSGAMAKMIAAAPGDEFRADFGAYGSVSVSFAG